MMFSGNSNTNHKNPRITQAGGSSASLLLGSVNRLKPETGLAVGWTFEEYCKLQEGLQKYADEPNIMKYIKIAATLRDKTVRDVTLASKWFTSDTISSDATAMVAVDIESLQQHSDKTSGDPEMIRGLSRKWLCRAEVLTNAEEEDVDESSKRTVAKELSTQLEPLMQSLLSDKSMTQDSANHGGSNLFDAAVRWNKKFNRFMAISPRKILCLVATLLSMASLALLYHTLAVNGKF
ncbi:uncharacterized protein LOC127809439 [Diospyros lotus]|uniref:uncharacterized protein LOC127809439 n=1 Tax=Diospyros lotus TaxID=55363 RepID=UPI00224EF8EE|nr:uncharacterized protein LOC127809439 [Diospyros lotus]XP_052204186.1 uncharacterized protein LOC127809439 [Diospyros lotus]XP_052204187.1 uncharacterized protein LOC127809439 [Diospyros lotus]